MVPTNGALHVLATIYFLNSGVAFRAMISLVWVRVVAIILGLNLRAGFTLMPFYSAFCTKWFLTGRAVNWPHIFFDFSHVNGCIASRSRTEPAVFRVEDYFNVSFYFLVLFNFLFGQIWLEFLLWEDTLAGKLGTFDLQATIVIESVYDGNTVGFEALFTERVTTLGKLNLSRPQPCSLTPWFHVVVTYGTGLELLRHQLI